MMRDFQTLTPEEVDFDINHEEQLDRTRTIVAMEGRQNWTLIERGMTTELFHA